MADIEKACPACKSVVTISELAERFTCPKCGGQTSLDPVGERAAEAPAAARREKLRLREGIGASPEETSEPEKAGRRKGAKIPMRPRDRRSASTVITPHHLISWILFLVIGGVMAGCRYAGWMNGAQMETLRTASPIVLLVLYVLSLLTIFYDSIFAGILSLLIPPYALYYLLARSDRFVLRAIVAGLLVGIGQYAAEFISLKWTESVVRVQNYILSGG